METETPLRDTDLLSLLSAAQQTRQQCLDLLALLDSHPTANSDPSLLPPQVQNDISDRQKSVQARMAKLRSEQRGVAVSVRATKQATADARTEVDGLHLRLQNLYYERAHLRGEIGACEDYDHQYTQLPLIPRDEFLQLRPDLVDADGAVDEHAVMIARIEHEHAGRQKLEDQRQGLLKRKQELIAENKKRKDDLANLDRDLEKFIDAAEPISTRFEKDY